MSIQFLEDQMAGIQLDLNGVKDKRTELQKDRERLTTHRTELRKKLDSLLGQKAITAISDEEDAEIDTLHEALECADRELLSNDRMLALNQERIDGLNKDMADNHGKLQNLRKVESRSEIDELYDESAIEASRALARLAVLIRMKHGTPLATIDATKICNAIINRSTGGYFAEYQAEGARYLAELIEKFKLEEAA